MKFFKFMLVLTLSILIISGTAIVIGVYYAHQINDQENNTFYSGLSYRLIEQQIDNKIESYENRLFYAPNATEIQNLVTFSVFSEIEQDTIKSKIEDIARNTSMTGYYYEIDKDNIVSNADENFISQILQIVGENNSTQVLIMNSDQLDNTFVVFIKSSFNYSEAQNRDIIYYTPFESFMTIEQLNYITNEDDFVKIEVYSKAMVEHMKNLISFEEGYIDIDEMEYNYLYIPLLSNPENYAVISILKPEIIGEINDKIKLILVIILINFIGFTAIVLLVSKRVSKNLNAVVSKVNRVANGDYSEKVQMSTIYEFQQITDSINQMSDTISMKIKELSDKNSEILRLMVEALDATDTYTKGHSERVARFVYILGEKLGYKDLDMLITAALLHDIGKISVPEHVLNKPGKLTDDEFNLIKLHVITGQRILSKSKTFNEIEEMVRHHHERYDGKGYPDGLKDNAIPLGAKLISICDVYDALTSNRPYRKAMSHMDAMKLIMDSSGTQFDPELVNAFIAIEPLLDLDR